MTAEPWRGPERSATERSATEWLILSRPDGSDAAANLMEKAGMRRVGVLRRWFVHPALSPEPRDCVMFARTR